MSNQTQKESIQHLPGHILLDLARNEAAPKAMRKAAVELMIANKFPQAKHPEVRLLLLEIEDENKARVEVQDIVETAVESPIEPVGPFKASVTTKTL